MEDALKFIAIRVPVVNVDEDLSGIILKALKVRNLSLVQGDILAVPSKIVSVCEGCLVRLDRIRVSKRAAKIASKRDMDSRLVQIILNEADMILGGAPGFLLTVKNGILTPNAGVDLKNSPSDTAALWPRDPDHSANVLRKSLQAHYHAGIGVLVVDSRVTPMRLGTTGLAIGLSGFLPLRSLRDKRDLYGRGIEATIANIADNLAAACHFLMGEADERIGAVLCRNAYPELGKQYSSRYMKLAKSKCLVARNLQLEKLD